MFRKMSELEHLSNINACANGGGVTRNNVVVFVILLLLQVKCSLLFVRERQYTFLY